jgi:hypothetical protein
MIAWPGKSLRCHYRNPEQLHDRRALVAARRAEDERLGD